MASQEYYDWDQHEEIEDETLEQWVVRITPEVISLLEEKLPEIDKEILHWKVRREVLRFRAKFLIAYWIIFPITSYLLAVWLIKSMPLFGAVMLTFILGFTFGFLFKKLERPLGWWRVKHKLARQYRKERKVV